MKPADRPAVLKVGVVVAGYRLERKVGEGGMGEVWAATDVQRQVKVALKMLTREAVRNSEIAARFRREAELLARIDSAHVPRLYDFLLDQWGGRILVEEFVDGQLLAEMLDQRRFSVAETRDLGVALARALIELHRAGVVHRDLKPSNVILKPVADGYRAVLIDFGVSRKNTRAEDEDDHRMPEITRVGRALGTITYMAPEQLAGSREATETVDLYALGAILYRAVTSRHVFGELQGLELARTKLMRDAPRLDAGAGLMAGGLEDVVVRLLRRWPAERYRSAEELLADLLVLGQAPQPPGELAAGTPAPPVSMVIETSSLPSAIERPSVAPAPSRRVVAAIALAAGVLLGAAGDRLLARPPASERAASRPGARGPAATPSHDPTFCESAFALALLGACTPPTRAIEPALATRSGARASGRHAASGPPVRQLVDSETPRRHQ